MQKEDELICCFCKNQFTINGFPRMMPYCQHSGCTPCLKQLMNNKTSLIICQHCGHQQIIEEWNLECFPKNIALTKLIKEKSLSLPSENQESSKDTVESSHSVSMEKQMCQIHQKQIEIICLTDKEKMCPHCALFGKHKDHQFKTVYEATLLMNQRYDEFNHFRLKKQGLDAKINSAEFRQSIIKRIAEQKDRLVLEIKDKFEQMNDNIRLAQKKAYQDVVKIFKNLSQKISAVMKEESDSHKKYKQWEQKCCQLFQKASKSSKIEEKVGYYFGGPLQLCSEGEALLKRIQFKVDSNISTIETLISKIQIVENPATTKSIFNYINVVVDNSLESDSFEHVPQQILSPREIKPEQCKKTRIEFSPNPLMKVPVLRITPNKNSTSKQNMHKVYQKNISTTSNCSQRGSVQQLIQQFCERDNSDTLDLTGFSLNDIEIYQILKYLKPIKKIKGLKLIKNKLTTSGFSKIIDYIPTVTNLNLAFNLLSDEALTILLDNRSKISLLRIINISNNKINERKVKSTIDELKKKGLIVTI